MAIAYVNKAAKAVVDATTSPSGNALAGVSAGNCLVVTASVYNTNPAFTITSVTDGTNTYTVRSAVHTQGSVQRQYEVVAYALNVSAGSFTPTINVSGADAGNTYAVVGMTEFSGVATSSAEDTWDANDDQLITSADLNAGPITTTDAGALIIGGAGFVADSSTSLAWSDPTSWTNLYRQDDGYSSGTGHDSGYWLPGSTQATYSPQWSHRNIATNEGSALVVALKAAAGGGASAPDNLLMMPPMLAAGRVAR